MNNDQYSNSPLTNQSFSNIIKDGLMYDPSTGVFTWENDRKRGIKAGSVAGGHCGGGYIKIKIYGKSIKAHRLAWFFVFGSWPNGVIDHINGNGMDNRIGNLRDVDQSVNNLNRFAARKDSGTGVRGVTYDEKKKLYRAHMQVRGKRYYLGRFKIKSDAEAARVRFEEEIKKQDTSWQPCYKLIDTP